MGTYAEALRKNLKREEAPAVEDVFESFASYINKLSHVSEERQESARVEDPLDIFTPWRHNLSVGRPRMEDVDILASTLCIPSLAAFTCGQPTIPVVKKMVEPAKKGPAARASKMSKSKGVEAKAVDIKKQQKEVANPTTVPEAKFSPKAVKKAATQEVVEQKVIQKPESPKVAKRNPKKEGLEVKPTFIDPLTVVPETKQTPKAAKKAAPKELPKEPVKLATEIKQTGAVQMKASAPKVPAPVVQTRKAVVAKKKQLQLDYTQESFFDDWIHNLAVQEEVKKPSTFPLTPRPSPKRQGRGSWSWTTPANPSSW